MGTTTFTGPVTSGDLFQGQTNGPNQGFARLSQFTSLGQNGSNVVSSTLYVPAGSILQSFDVDVLTAFNNANTVTITVGTSANSTLYAGSIDAKTAGRASITYTAAQLAAMAGVTLTGGASPTTASVVITATPTGGTAPTAGYVAVAVNYVQTTSSN